jgi:pyruvate/2-oxoglutarate dehydrogenase complex dihydrolipoamide acyltransferase (E2) component
MASKRTFQSQPLSFNRLAVKASAQVTSDTSTLHCLTEVDISAVRQLMKTYFEQTGQKLSMTAYVVTCLAATLKEFPHFNAFIKGRRMVMMKELTISVLVEREYEGEKVPEPLGIQNAQSKSFLQIQSEIRAAQKDTGQALGSLGENRWFRLIPGFLLRTFIRLADRNLKMAQTYGKVGVTAVGMFGSGASWFIPHGSSTVLVTVGGIEEKVVKREGEFVTREHLCLTVSFDHAIVDGAPAARFVKRFSELLEGGTLLDLENT